MTNYFDDDSFWDEQAGESTSQVRRIDRRVPERTRTHHLVTRDTAPPAHDRDDETLWVEPRLRSNERLGTLGSVDPRLLSVGAMAIAAVLAVPLFGAFSNNDGNDDGFRTVAEARATTTTAVEITLAPASTEVVVTAALNPEFSEPPDAEAGIDDSSDDSSNSDSSDTASSGEAAAPAALRAPINCSNTYEAVAGDYWLGIAESAAISPEDLLAINGASAETAIFPGDDVCLPDGATIGGSAGGGSPAGGSPAGGSTTGGTARVTEPASCTNVYEPVAGDYWLRIAEVTGASLDDLLAKNSATGDTPLYPGAAICLPAGASAPASSTEAPTTLAPTTEPATTQATTTAPPTTESTTTAPTTEAPASTAPATPAPSGGEVEQMIRDVWPDELEEQALRIAWRESNYRPDVTSGTGCCVGVFQMHWEAHRGWLQELGITSRDQLFDARTNIEAAYALYQRNGGWGPWAQTAG